MGRNISPKKSQASSVVRLLDFICAQFGRTTKRGSQLSSGICFSPVRKIFLPTQSSYPNSGLLWVNRPDASSRAQKIYSTARSIRRFATCETVSTTHQSPLALRH